MTDGRLLGAEERLREYFAGAPHLKQGAVHGLNEADATVIEAALHQNLLLRNVTVDRARLSESYEAWVQVQIATPEAPLPLFEGLGPFPMSGVLTWTGHH